MCSLVPDQAPVNHVVQGMAIIDQSTCVVNDQNNDDMLSTLLQQASMYTMHLLHSL